MAAFPVPVLLDEAQLVAEALQLTSIGELLVIDPKPMSVAYRGLLTELTAAPHANAQRALAALVAGETVEPVTSTLPNVAAADAITFPSRSKFAQQPVSYTRDIVPMLQNNCVSCHQPGGLPHGP